MSKINTFARLIATFFFVGYSKKIPGTAGSFAGLLVWLFLLHLKIPAFYLFLIFIATLSIGWWSANHYVQKSGVKDPQPIVIDEVLGIWITFAGIVVNSWNVAIMGFFLFRIFDITKPLFIRKLEKLKDGAGVISDDLLAGAYANILLRILIAWWS